MHEDVLLTDLAAINPRYNLEKGETTPFLEMAKLPVIGGKITTWDQKKFNGGGARFKNGDTLFARITPCTENGKIGFVDFLSDGQTAFGSTEFTVISPKDGAHPQFVYHLCSSNHVRVPAIESMIGSTGRQRVPNWIFKNINVACFSYTEQERIAEILSSVDDSIRVTEAVIEQAGRVKLGLMKDLLTGGLSSEAIACGAAPEGWRTMFLGELTRIAGGTTPKRKTAEYWEDVSISWATPTDITSMAASVYKLFDTKEKISEAAVSKGGSKIFPERTVLMTSRATIGYVAVAQVPISTNQGFANFLPNEKYNPQFLCYLLESKRGELIQRAGGSTFKEISKSSLRGFQIMLPPLTEQLRIAEILSSVDDQIVANRASADQLHRLKRGLMDDLLTGRVRTVS